MRLYWKAALAGVALVVILNLAGFIPGLADAYANAAYPVLTAPLSRLSALVPLPIGELLMYLAAAALAASLAIALLLIPFRKKPRFAKGARRHLKACLAALLIGGLVFTLNWALPFHATPMSSQYDGQEYTLADLQSLRNYVIGGVNQAAVDAPRDAEGELAYGDDADEQVLLAMQALSQEFPRLGGFYPIAKQALCSDALEWMGIGGYTYPYTMELTYNGHVSPLYYPTLIAHEQAHHKGYYLESEATFLSFLACSQSSDAILRYSAFETMYYYVEEAYVQALVDAYSPELAVECFCAQPQLSDQVKADLQLAQEQRQQAYEQSVNSQAEEAFSNAAQSASDLGWNAQAQVLDQNNYDGVVRLLLGYYHSKL